MDILAPEMYILTPKMYGYHHRIMFSRQKKYINLSSQGDMRVESMVNTTGFLLIQSLMLNPEVPFKH